MNLPADVAADIREALDYLDDAMRRPDVDETPLVALIDRLRGYLLMQPDPPMPRRAYEMLVHLTADTEVDLDQMMTVLDHFTEDIAGETQHYRRDRDGGNLVACLVVTPSAPAGSQYEAAVRDWKAARDADSDS